MSKNVKMLLSVIDLGNYNVKGINQDGVRVDFKSVISKNFETYPDGFNYVLHEGEYTYFEKGVFSKEYIKTNKDYTSQVLYSVSKLHEAIENIDTKLTLLLPISEMENSNKYVESFKDKEFKFTVKTSKKMDKTIKINDVLVLPECYATYFVLDDTIKTLSVLIIDIGGRTTNVVAMIAGKPEILKTYKIGILNFYSKIKNINESKDCNIEDIERLIKKGDIVIDEKQLASFMNEVINEIKIDANLAHYDKVIFTGGSSIVVKDVIEKLPDSCSLHEEPLWSNVLGALEVSKITWGIKDEQQQQGA
jgi:plasmid segregation protein ParM